VKILILGGYGTFGGRLARLLADEPALTLLIAGRSVEKAVAFCAALAGKAQCRPLAFDRDADVESQLARIAPDLVVDASGPFQSYGDDPYRVVKAALALGICYLDLADGAAFVRGIGQFDAAARARGIFVLAGVSSLPVLTAAAVRQLAHGLARVEAITGGIAPSPYAGVGPNVIRAVSGYAGKPTALIRDGRPAVGYASRSRCATPSRRPADCRSGISASRSWTCPISSCCPPYGRICGQSGSASARCRSRCIAR
jgi:Saccharopine dehydrogenase NADP binding domain